MDLSGVEWAALSARGTGAGKVRAVEEVLGLRRAFHVAGAGIVIMSLGSVPDQPTRDWMVELYRERLEGRLGTAEAVRQASLRVLARRRAGGRGAYPFFWGGFIAAGRGC